MMEEFTAVQPEQALEQPDAMPREAAAPEEAPEAVQAPGEGPGLPGEPELPEPDPRLDEILKAAKSANARLEELLGAFERRIAHTDMEEKVIDRMHAELQRYKEDLYAQLVRPILLDIIEVRDSIQRMAATYLARPEGEQSIPNKTFSDYAYDLQDILEKNQVEVYRSRPGDSFTPLRQRVLKKVKTGEEGLHGALAESLSCGYAYGGRVLSPEKIAVYVYEKPPEEPAAARTEENMGAPESVPEPDNLEKSEKSEENDNG